MKLVYIAGKLTDPDAATMFHFRQQALEMGMLVESAGDYMAFVPHAHVLEPKGTPEEVWKAAMRKCITMLRRCDYLVPLDNWVNSRGARMEVWLCKRRSGFPKVVDLGSLILEGLDGEDVA